VVRGEIARSEQRLQSSKIAQLSDAQFFPVLQTQQRVSKLSEQTGSE
jgi:hypothetical protein